MAQPLSRPRAYSPLVLVLVSVGVLGLMVLGYVAGNWQYGRHQVRSEAISAFNAAHEVPPVLLDELVSPGATTAKPVEWRSVTVTGTFSEAQPVALRGRVVERTASLQYLAWFNTTSGAILVNVGWEPRDTATVPRLPQGEVTIGGVLREQEPDDGKRGDGATRVNAAQMPPANSPTFPGWIMLREPCEVSGCVDTALAPVPTPQLSLGPHLSYAYQWWLLVVAAPILAAVILRRDAAHERVAAGQGETPPKGARVRKQRELTDEEIEDAL